MQSVLPSLMEKTLQRGWRALVKLPEGQLADMDQFLWTYQDQSFLPHGREDEPLADQQPILLSATAEAANGADCVVLIDGSDIADLSGVSRCIVMINGRNEDSVVRERQRWNALKKAGATLSYWQQDERGQWKKKA